jgi:hypothetical protein
MELYAYVADGWLGILRFCWGAWSRRMPERKEADRDFVSGSGN